MTGTGRNRPVPKVLRRLKELTVEKVTESVSKYVIEFDYIDPNPNDGMTRLQVTFTADALTVHDVWDAKATDYEVDWMDLRRMARLVHEWDEHVREMKLNREMVNGMIRELQCQVLTLRRQPSPCPAPPMCHVTIALLGPAPRGELERCDVHPREWSLLREV